MLRVECRGHEVQIPLAPSHTTASFTVCRSSEGAEAAGRTLAQQSEAERVGIDQDEVDY
jgi:hypothetical protein